MLTAAIPLIKVRTSEEGLSFYRDRLRFEVRSAYRSRAETRDPAYFVMVREGATIHVSSFPGDGVAGGGVVTVLVSDIAALHDELIRAGVDVGLGIMDQPWGDREVYVRDPAGNTIRFQSQ